MLVALLVAVLGLMAPPAAAHRYAYDPATRDASPGARSSGLRRVGQLEHRGDLNTDLAFWGDRVYAGSYGGVRIIDISDPTEPRPLGKVACPGGQNDVAVYRNLLITSTDDPRTGPGCRRREAHGRAGWEGLRIFDVSNPRRPRRVGAVATDCGSHTHTLIPQPGRNRVLVYVSSYSGTASTFGATSFGNHCRTDHGYLSVVSIPLNRPGRARVVAKPRLPLSRYFATGGNGCHDVGVLLGRDLAAAACSGEALILDISKPLRPKVKARIDDRRVAYYHSGSFTYDGKVAIFGDEPYGGRGAACTDPGDSRGRAWFYRVRTGRLLGTFKIPRRQSADQNCTVHNYNVVPVAGQYLLASGWYQGGTSLVDFSDPFHAREIAFHDYAALRPGHLTLGGSWSSYFYRGHIYANTITAGLDVYRFRGRQTADARHLRWLNPQTQRLLPGAGPRRAAAVGTVSRARCGAAAGAVNGCP